MSNIHGLKQQIANASSVEEITKLLNLGKTYNLAANKTITSWKNAAVKRLNQLQKKDQTVISESNANVTKKKKVTSIKKKK